MSKSSRVASNESPFCNQTLYPVYVPLFQANLIPGVPGHIFSCCTVCKIYIICSCVYQWKSVLETDTLFTLHMQNDFYCSRTDSEDGVNGSCSILELFNEMVLQCEYIVLSLCQKCIRVCKCAFVIVVSCNIVV